MASRKDIISFIDSFLDISAFEDRSPNGLQVLGKADVDRIALGVSLNLDLINEAIKRDADLILTHHGLFWGENRIDTEIVKNRLKRLLEKDINHAAYHLPLDAHPEIGNNILLLKEIGLTYAGAFGEVHGRTIGVLGECNLQFEQLISKLRQQGFTPRFYKQREPKLVGIITGRAGSLIDDAVRACDTFITGELQENSQSYSKEAGLNIIALGHYDSEKAGIVRLGEVLEKEFAVHAFFIDIPNGI